MGEISRRVGRPELGRSLPERVDRAYETTPVLAMLFGREQIAKGEHEVIALAFAMHLDGRHFALIMDDADGRKMVRNRFAHLAPFMTGTAGFIARCHTRYSILAKGEALEALEAIRASKFRATNGVIDSAVEEVRRH